MAYYGVITKDQSTMMSDRECWRKGILQKPINIDYTLSMTNTLQIHKLTRISGENGPITLFKDNAQFSQEYVSNQRLGCGLPEKE